MSTKDQNVSRSSHWRYKLWEWNAGWMGLAVAFAWAWMATEGLKDLYGRPRPDMLARCNPDLSNIATYAVGGLGEKLAGAPTLVTWKICQNKSKVLANDGFASFPSGHSSRKWLMSDPEGLHILTPCSFFCRLDILDFMAVFKVLNRISIPRTLFVEPKSDRPDTWINSKTWSSPAGLYACNRVCAYCSCQLHCCIPLVRLSSSRF